MTGGHSGAAGGKRVTWAEARQLAAAASERIQEKRRQLAIREAGRCQYCGLIDGPCGCAATIADGWTPTRVAVGCILTGDTEADIDCTQFHDDAPWDCCKWCERDGGQHCGMCERFELEDDGPADVKCPGCQDVFPGDIEGPFCSACQSIRSAPLVDFEVIEDAVWVREAQTWGQDTQDWAEATAPAAQEAWDRSIGLSPDEAVRQAAASAALAGVPVSEEWKAKVRAALDQDDPDAALDAVVAREIGGLGDGYVDPWAGGGGA